MTSFNTRNRGGTGDTGAGGNAPAPAAPMAPVSRWAQLAGAATSVALVLGVVVWGYKLAVRDVSGVPIIRALEGPSRIAPEVPGGDMAAHVGLAVNEVAGTGLAAPGPERVVLAPQAEALAPEDAPMASLRPLPNPKSRPEVAAAAAPVAPPVTDPLPTAPTAPAPDLPDTADGVAAAEGEAPLAETAPEAAAEAPPEAVPPLASGTGVVRSPRPVARPENRDLEAEAAALAVAQALGGGGSAANVEIDPANLAEGTRVAQLGAFDSAEIARAEWDKIAARFEPLMAGKKRIVQEAVSGGRSFWRLRVQGFETVEDARRFCAALVAEGANCIPTLAK